MMAEESSVERSVNRVVICGVVTRMMTKAKKPISAAVTAIIAIKRAAPRPLRKSTRPFQPPPPQLPCRLLERIDIRAGLLIGGPVANGEAPSEASNCQWPFLVTVE